MVRGLARDFGNRGITVNSIQPGPTDSDINPADGPMAQTMHSFMAIKRHVRVSEIAEFVGLPCRPSWRNDHRIAADYRRRLRHLTDAEA
jgi:cyclic-di-GMP-binding biofilm dispersal mediator protein